MADIEKDGVTAPDGSVPTAQAVEVAAPDLATLWCDPRSGQFDVVISVQATVRETVKAASAEEARTIVNAMIDNDSIDLMAEDIDEARIDSVRADQPMYAVFRDGQEMGVSHPRPGDRPRTPTSAYDLARYTVAPTATGASQ